MIEVSGLTKTFSGSPVVNDLSFQIDMGEIVGFLGPNGAGKTTTLRILTGYLPPTTGQVLIAGFDVTKYPTEVRRRIGYLPERIPLYEEMKVRGYLRFVAEMKGVERRRRSDEVERVTRWSGASEVSDRLIKRLSHGFRQRVGLAQAMIGDPDVILLDEPTSGLDPEQAAGFRDRIQSLRGNKTVLLSTHVLSEASQICDRVMIMNRGKLVVVDTPANLDRNFGGSSIVSITVKEGSESELLAGLRALSGVGSVEEIKSSGGERTYRIMCDSGIDPRSGIVRAISVSGAELMELRRESLSLEEIFLELTSDRKDRGED